MVSGCQWFDLDDDVVFPILMQAKMYGDILQKNAFDDDTVEYRRDSDHVYERRKDDDRYIYIAYPEGRSVTTRERVGWKSERIEP
jgi:hypothetical protein